MNGTVFISAMQMSVSTAMLSVVIRKLRDFIRRPPSLIMENVYTGQSKELEPTASHSL